MEVITHLLPLIKVPYLPILGPVRPKTITADFLQSLLNNDEKALSHDKNKRWVGQAPETVVGSGIYATSTTAIIPTIQKNHLRLYVYGEKPNVQAITAIERPVPHNRTTMVTFSLDETAQADQSILFERDFTSDDRNTDAECDILSEKDAVLLEDVGKDPENEGIAYLATQLGRRDIGPVFAVKEKAKVIGVIGPVGIAKDSGGSTFCLPPYFGVKSGYRGRGVGRRLWTAMSRYAAEHGAEYLLIQAEVGQPSEAFYRSAGCTELGYIQRQAIK